ncbi:uncharacterized protein LOC118199123 [Stegodyphus dumicola]|uniref:uncharacterized protein LOC118199123 n=1 Tax=Stegodyphus dumicola TaxID=202533 RepID=UPI0015ADE51B|nr:uncharacterized protein LOC118199123 [Stegodyphus dumicola]
MECRTPSNQTDIPLKVLGLIWDNDKDTLKIDLNQFTKFKYVTPTKRTVLSACGMLFDPLGLITPFSVIIKLIVQNLWEKRLKWDENIPEELESMFQVWWNEVSELEKFVIPRLYFDEQKIQQLERGPLWLIESDVLNSEEIPNADIDTFEAEKERKKNCIALPTYVKRTDSLLNLHGNSDLSKVLRITAYVLRLINNCKRNSERCKEVLTAEELASAERYWIRFLQRSEFEKDLIKLTRKETLSSDSKLYGLKPILTAEGLICLGGRLQNSEFQFQEKQPWIIPKKSRFTELLIKREHENLLHAGVSDTLTQTREKYWIIRGRQAVKSCLNNCFVCRKFKAKRGTQVTAPLPADRIHEANPFEITGFDFAGPLFTKNGDKVYICLFTCAVTRAVHLEIVSSLSTEHFLLAFRRFVSRRGVCRTINSDNGQNF